MPQHPRINASAISVIAWDVSLQRHIPPQALARVYSYDALGSFIAIPLGEVAVGPLAAQIGTSTTFIGCAAVITAATLLALLNTNVRQLRTTPTALSPADQDGQRFS